MSSKDEIILLYYEKKLNIIEISSQLNVTKQYVSKIVRKDVRHFEETERRKQESKNKQKQRAIEYISKKRALKKKENLDAIIEVEHFKASVELSGRKFINNRTYRNWNSSIYGFYAKTKEYRVKPEFKDKVSYATPKKIKWD